MIYIKKKQLFRQFLYKIEHLREEYWRKESVYLVSASWAESYIVEFHLAQIIIDNEQVERHEKSIGYAPSKPPT